MDAVTLALAKKYTKDSMAGAGAVKGQKGDKGDTGAVGPAGPQGAQGPKGDTGATGPQGEKGADGQSFTIKGAYATYDDLIEAHPTGKAGEAYYIGTESTEDTDNDPDLYVWLSDEERWFNNGPVKGATGPQGPQGVQGEQGPQGEVGPQGPQGPKGDTGAQGPAGKDAEVTVMKGATDTEDGKGGLVPQPKKGDENKLLGGDGVYHDKSIFGIEKLEDNISEIPNKYLLRESVSRSTPLFNYYTYVNNPDPYDKNNPVRYIKMLSIASKSNYANYPISIEYSGRDTKPGILTICFTSEDNTSPNIKVFYTNASEAPFFIHKQDGTNRWDIYYKLSELSYGELTIYRIFGTAIDERVDYKLYTDHKEYNISELPEGVIQALPDTGNIYSTSETPIGTWIDGKPIYREVVEGTTATIDGATMIKQENITYGDKSYVVCEYTKANAAQAKESVFTEEE